LRTYVFGRVPIETRAFQRGPMRLVDELYC